MNQINKAKQFAKRFHGDQKYGNKQYFYHLENVANIVEDYGEDCIILAYLHDVVEDTDCSLTDIQDNFGIVMANYVWLITDCIDDNRKERKRKTYVKFLNNKEDNKCQDVFIVKTADRLSNLRECVKEDNQKLLNMYKKEHKSFRNVVYVENLCEEIWNEIEEIINN